MSCPPSQPAYLPSDTPTYPSLPSDQPFKLTTRPEPAYSPTGLNLSTRTRAQPRTVPTRDPYAACRFLQLPAGACRCMPLSAYLPADPTRGETRRAPYPSRPPYPPPCRGVHPTLADHPTCLPAYRVYLPFYPTNQPSSLPPLKYQVAVADPLPAACLSAAKKKDGEGWRDGAVADHPASLASRACLAYPACLPYPLPLPSLPAYLIFESKG